MTALGISLIVLFIHATTWDSMINSWIGKYIPPEGWLYKPIYGCPICMTPYYGLLMLLLFSPFSFTGWMITLGTASGISVIWVILLTLRDALLIYIDKNEDAS